MSGRILSALCAAPVRACGRADSPTCPCLLPAGWCRRRLLGLVPIYFWCLVRPDLMTPAAVFAIGLLEDVLSGGPPGVWTLSFVVTYARDRPPARRLRGPVGPGRRSGFRHRRPDRLRRAPICDHRRCFTGTLPPLGPMVARAGDDGAVLRSRRLWSSAVSTAAWSAARGATSDAAVRQEGQKPLRHLHPPLAGDGRRHDRWSSRCWPAGSISSRSATATST